MQILVNVPKGILFLVSVDTYDISKRAKKDNAANYKAANDWLMDKSLKIVLNSMCNSVVLI